jgi:DNA-directed RNA polymerase subunit omega
MARVTVEDCMESINNRFVLVQMSNKRTRQLLKGAKTLVVSDNREIVNSLREIAQKKAFLGSEAKESLQKECCITLEEEEPET